MSDNGEVEVEVPSVTSNVLPKDVTAEIGSIKLFNKWSYEDVEIRDISLTYATTVSREGQQVANSEQRLHPNPRPSLHLTLSRSICRKAIPQGPMPDH